MTNLPLIEQHFHGAFGINFNTASVDEIISLAKEMKKYGFYGFFPTLVTDKIDNIKKQIKNIKLATQQQNSEMAKILGIHLEGIFINPLKKGIHDENLFLEPNVKNFQQIEDDFIKIVTLAPELDNGLIEYLNKKNIKVQAGHCTGENLKGCSGTTHLFNAMTGIHHREKSTSLSALLNDNVYVEIIADGIHLSDDILDLIFKTKPLDKIILISDCLPCTHCDNLKEFEFAGKTIFYNNNKATSKDGILAGSSMLLTDIIERLNKKFDEKIVNQLIKNTYNYHNIAY